MGILISKFIYFWVNISWQLITNSMVFSSTLLSNMSNEVACTTNKGSHIPEYFSEINDLYKWQDNRLYANRYLLCKFLPILLSFVIFLQNFS